MTFIYELDPYSLEICGMCKYELYVHHNRLDVRKQFYACRVVNVSNSLPAEYTNFSSLTSFRLSLPSVDFSKF